MEYMAFELPVVAFDLSETRVSAGDAAVYVRPNDVSSFARASPTLLDDPSRRETWAGSGGSASRTSSRGTPGPALRQGVREGSGRGPAATPAATLQDCRAVGLRPCPRRRRRPRRRSSSDSVRRGGHPGLGGEAHTDLAGLHRVDELLDLGDRQRLCRPVVEAQRRRGREMASSSPSTSLTNRP